MRVLRGLALSALGASVTGLVIQPYSRIYGTIRSIRSQNYANRFVKRPSGAAPSAAAGGASHRTSLTRRRKRPLRSASEDHEAPAAPPSPSAPPGSVSVATTAKEPPPTHTPALVNRGSSAATGGPETQLDDDVRVEVSPLQSNPSAISSLLPLALLNVVTVLWGTQHAVIKLVLEGDLTPGVANFARFSFAALLFSPWTPGLLRDVPPLSFLPSAKDLKENTTGGGQGAAAGETEGSMDGDALDTWRAGAELGVWMFLGFAFQAIGLEFTTASRSAFLLYLNVKLVPFFAFALEGRNISIATWIGAFLAFFGTVLLSSDGTPPNIGDLWSVMAAATSAMFILRLERYSGSCDPSRLNSANLWVTAGLCGLWAAWEITSGRADGTAAMDGLRSKGALIAYLAVVTTALTNWMQVVGQRSVPAERAAVIYAMDPVYAAGFAFLLLGETLGPAGIVGASIITGAALWSQEQQRLEVADSKSAERQSLPGEEPKGIVK